MTPLFEILTQLDMTNKELVELCGHPDRTVLYWKTKKCPPIVLWAMSLYVENIKLKYELYTNLQVCKSFDIKDKRQFVINKEGGIPC